MIKFLQSLILDQFLRELCLCVCARACTCVHDSY